MSPSHSPPTLTASAPDPAGKGVEAVLRVSVSVAALDHTMKRIRMRIGLGSIAVMVLAGMVTLLVSRNISRPLEQMTKSAERFASGDFSLRMLPV